MPREGLLWRLYYADKTTFDNLRGSWEEAPLTGVIAVAVVDKTKGRLVYNQTNFYYLLGDSEVGSTDFLEDLVIRYGADFTAWNTRDEFEALMQTHRQVKWGAWVTHENYKEVSEMATADPDFPKCSPRRRWTDFPHPK